MLTIEILAVGKIKEKYLNDAISEYSKRLSRYCIFKITEVQDYSDSSSSVEREASLILPKMKGACISLCIEGKQLSSTDFANLISEFAVNGISHLTFIIGGSCGLDDNIKSKSVHKLSFSKMTFPHKLMRVILSEQIYRAFKILNNESYHK